MAATVAAAARPRAGRRRSPTRSRPTLGRGAAHDAAAEAVREARGDRPAAARGARRARPTSTSTRCSRRARRRGGRRAGRRRPRRPRPTDRGDRMTAVAVSYTVDGAADAPVVVLSNSLGADPRHVGSAGARRWPSGTAWSPTTPAGTGSRRRRPGPYTLDDLVDDLVALLDEVGAERAHVAGLSLGGMTGDAAGRPRARSGSTGWRCCAPRRSRTRSRSSTGRPPSAPAAPRPLAPAVAGRG